MTYRLIAAWLAGWVIRRCALLLLGWAARLPAPACSPVIAPPHPTPPLRAQAFVDRSKKAAAGGEPLATSIAQFYQTDAISRASKVMAKCIKVSWGSS